MSERARRREAAIEPMADHVLEVGLEGASLRPLAAAAGVSDRMLLYYFADKQDLLSAVLERIAARLTARLDAAVPPDMDLPYSALLVRTWAALRSNEIAPYMALWLELAAGAARRRQPHLAVAGAIAEGFLAWAVARLRGPSADRAREAALLLTTVEGLMLMEAIGRGDIAGAALDGG